MEEGYTARDSEVWAPMNTTMRKHGVWEVKIRIHKE